MSIDTLITAEQFAEMEFDDPCELVRGEIVKLSPTRQPHGLICTRIARLLDEHSEQAACGRAVSNDSGLLLEQDPDTLRCPDVYWMSNATIEKNGLVQGFSESAPELAVEVISPSDRWSMILEKVGQYLNFGVTEVWLIDFNTMQIHVYQADHPPRTLGIEETLENTIVPGFSTPVQRVFANALP